jgi:hypothetical protein
MRTSFHAAAAVVFGALLAAAFGSNAQAAPLTNSRVITEQAVSDGLAVKAVTRAGVYHRHARRTSRRVYRRHHYY